MKNSQLIKTIIFLVCIIIGLGFMIIAKRAQHITNRAFPEAKKSSLSPIPTPLLSKSYVEKNGQFQFQYPESWILVETGPKTFILAKDAVDATPAKLVSPNGIKLEVQITDGVSGIDLSRYVACTAEASGCEVITFNGQPYKVSEMVKMGERELKYETIYGIKQFSAVVSIGGGTAQKNNIQALTSIVSSFTWKK